MKKQFRIMEYIGCGFAEVIFAYPNFKSLDDGLKYIRIILDPYLTGRYGIDVDK